jgi:anthranilate phosphoribosyltransferase
MNTALKKLYEYQSLDRSEAGEALYQMLTSEVNSSHTTAFITAYNMRQPTVDEMLGFVDTMTTLSVKPFGQMREAIDIVGTGGDRKNTFNISTLSAIVVAAAGYTVIKHGNYGSTSISGSSNVLEHLGYKFTNDSQRLNRQLESANICFLHAPMFHPLMVKVKQVRKDLNVQTFFNLLGPLVNPASPECCFLGVAHHHHLKTYDYILQSLAKRYSIIHSMDGYDEISLTSAFKVITASTTVLKLPEELGFERNLPADIEAGETIDEAARVFMNILQGECTAQQQNTVVVNSAYAIQTIDPSKPISQCLEAAREALATGSALKTFKKLIDLS